MIKHTVLLHPVDVMHLVDYVHNVIEIRSHQHNSTLLMLMHEDGSFAMVNSNVYRLITQEVEAER